jgi:hypothetical protein
MGKEEERRRGQVRGEEGKSGPKGWKGEELEVSSQGFTRVGYSS